MRDALTPSGVLAGGLEADQNVALLPEKLPAGISLVRAVGFGADQPETELGEPTIQIRQIRRRNSSRVPSD